MRRHILGISRKPSTVRPPEGTYLTFNGAYLTFNGRFLHFDQPALTFGDAALTFGEDSYLRFK